jgi:hypothetical protein
LDIVEQVTGPAWIETRDGSRFPADFKESRKAIEGGYVWRDSEVMRGENISGNITIWNGQPAARLLRLEDRAGRRLLNARTTKGVRDIAPMVREVLEDESDEDEEDEAYLYFWDDLMDVNDYEH